MDQSSSLKTQTIGFLDMPREIRDRIYQESIVAAAPNGMLELVCDPEWPGPGRFDSKKEYDRGKPVSLPFLHLNRITHIESRDLLKDITVVLDTHRLLGLLKNPRQFGLLTKLRVKAPYANICHQHRYNIRDTLQQLQDADHIDSVFIELLAIYDMQMIQPPGSDEPIPLLRNSTDIANSLGLTFVVLDGFYRIKELPKITIIP